MENKLQKLGLDSGNSIVIGSGILDTLGIRISRDIDLIVSEDVYNSLKKSGKFKVSENNGREVLSNDLLEISQYWMQLGNVYKLNNLLEESVVIKDVRYITLEFLYKVKKSWIKEDAVPRQKDIEDIKLIEGYLKNK